MALKRPQPRAVVSSDYLLYSVEPVNTRLRYEMMSYLNAAFGQVENRYSMHRALQLPAGSNPRALELGRAARSEGTRNGSGQWGAAVRPGSRLGRAAGVNQSSVAS